MEVRELRYFLAVGKGREYHKGSREPAYCTAFSVKATDGTGEETWEKTSDPWKTEDHSDRGGGSFLRKRAEEILELVEKTQQEISSDTEDVIGDIYMGGGTPPSVLGAAAKLRERYPDVKFHFYSGDATDVSERLNHGTLDFAVMLQPIDNMKYDFFSLKEISQWGILAKKDDPFSSGKSDNKRRYQDNASHHASENWSSE